MAEVAQYALQTMQEYLARAIQEPWPGQSATADPRAQVRGLMLHLWYGGVDDEVLACEPIPLVDLEADALRLVRVQAGGGWPAREPSATRWTGSSAPRRQRLAQPQVVAAGIADTGVADTVGLIDGFLEDLHPGRA